MQNTQTISVNIPAAMAERLNTLQKTQKKSRRAIVAEALRQYLLRAEYEKICSYGFAKAAKAGKITEKDIDKVVHEVKRSTKRR